MNLRYAKEVLGVKQIIRPKNSPLSVYGSLNKKLMLLSGEGYSEEHKNLVERMTNSINQKHFFMVCLNKYPPETSSCLKNLIYRSSAELLIAFGKKPQEILKEAFPEVFLDSQSVFHKIVSLDLSKALSIRTVLTYSLSDFCSSSKPPLELRRIKLDAFSVLKKL